MHFTSETTADGVSEKLFVLDDIHGALWTSAEATGSRPLVLIGHGGGQHKKAPGVLARAHRYVTACGFAAAAIDAPGHGDRSMTEAEEQRVAEIRQRMATGEQVGPLIAAHNAEIATRAVPEWCATLDALQKAGHADGPVGFSGLSMGTAIGVRFVAAEPRVRAAVFGLMGHETLTEAAAKVSIPVQFLLQWDDEFIPRDSALTLFDAFASPKKTLHANPGGHIDVPRFEVDSSERFFRRHLLTSR